MNNEDSSRINKLLEETTSPDAETWKEAILCLGMLLEKNSPGANPESHYAEILPGNLMGVTVDEDLQARIVNKLFENLQTGKDSGSEFWAISKALPSVAFEPLLAIFQSWPDSLGDEAAFEAILAFQKFLPLDDEGHVSPEAAKRIALRDPTVFLRRMKNSSDSRLAEAARSTLEKLQKC